MPVLPSSPFAHSGVNVEAWTESTMEALGAIAISTPIAARGVRGTSVNLDIPLDDEPPPQQRHEKTANPAAFVNASTPSAYVRRRTLLRRDSLERREALLKGKEGSRRRQKWENDRLLGNPWAEPPLPSDWEVRPTYPVHSVPYFLAPLWDERQARDKLERSKNLRSNAVQEDHASIRVPKELREKLKRAKGAKHLLQDLEEQVREFIKMWDDKQAQLVQEGLADADSSEDEEIVFVGRNGQMKSPKSSAEKLQKDKLIFDSLVDDHGDGSYTLSLPTTTFGRGQSRRAIRRDEKPTSAFEMQDSNQDVPQKLALSYLNLYGA